MMLNRRNRKKWPPHLEWQVKQRHKGVAQKVNMPMAACSSNSSKSCPLHYGPQRKNTEPKSSHPAKLDGSSDRENRDTDSGSAAGIEKNEKHGQFQTDPQHAAELTETGATHWRLQQRHQRCRSFLPRMWRTQYCSQNTSEHKRSRRARRKTFTTKARKLHQLAQPQNILKQCTITHGRYKRLTIPIIHWKSEWQWVRKHNSVHNQGPRASRPLTNTESTRAQQRCDMNKELNLTIQAAMHIVTKHEASDLSSTLNKTNWQWEWQTMPSGSLHCQCGQGSADLDKKEP